jgi:hypothetical protein
VPRAGPLPYAKASLFSDKGPWNLGFEVLRKNSSFIHAYKILHVSQDVKPFGKKYFRPRGLAINIRHIFQKARAFGKNIIMKKFFPS